jgi:alpha-beta hydrolase superfamily lysophospholipase
MEAQTLENGDIRLATYTWKPEASPKAIVLILHGMQEYALRYDHFANFLSGNGYLVKAHDHRGHGRTAPSEEELGHFADSGGWTLCVEDILAHCRQIGTENPGVPLIIFGHSMGSFLVQELMIRNSDLFHAAVLSGSNGPPNTLAKVGRWIAKFERMRLGGRARSQLLANISLKEFNKKFQPVRTQHDWLSRDEALVDSYIADPLCGFLCSTQFWIDLLYGIKEFSKPIRQREIRKDLPVFIFSGARDPIGLDTHGVKQLIDAYSKAGLTSVEHIFYANGRHEMLNEINKEEVYADVLAFLEKVTG